MFVGENKEDGVSQLVLVQHAVELIACCGSKEREGEGRVRKEEEGKAALLYSPLFFAPSRPRAGTMNGLMTCSYTTLAPLVDG